MKEKISNKKYVIFALALILIGTVIAIVSMEKTDTVMITYGTETTTLSKMSLLELGFAYEREVDNPYDPKVIEANAFIKTPENELVKVPMFWYEDYNRELVNEREVLNATGIKQWRFRYTPQTVGEYEYYVEIKDYQNKKTERYPKRGTEKISVTNSTKDGFLKVSDDKQHLETIGGASFVGIGHNLCGWEWAGTDNMKGTYDYDSWLVQMKNAGANMAQFDLCEGDQIEWTTVEDELAWSDGYGGIGIYNQETAWKMDYKVKTSTDLDIFFRMTLYHWEDFDTETEQFSDWGWLRNPFNKENGGPCDNVNEFFTKEEAKEYTKQYLRYVVARWGYSPQLMLWELFNEVDAPEICWNENTNITTEMSQVTAWHDEMSGYLKEIDPYQHLVTTSFANSNLGNSIWSLENIDVSTFHRYTMYNSSYGQENYETVQSLNNIIQKRMFETEKPVIGGEFALSPGGEVQKNHDIEGVGFHNQIWASVMSNSFGTAMHWSWGSYLDENNLYFHYKALSNFVKGEDLRGMHTQNNFADTDSPLLFMALTKENRALVWVKDRKYDFCDVVNGYEEKVLSGSITISGLTDDVYIAEITDTWTNQILGVQTITVSGGKATVAIPNFSKDVAVKITPQKQQLSSKDLGDAKPLSKTVQTADSVLLRASGVGIGGTADDGRFAYYKLSGDFEITVQLDSLTYTNEFASAGLIAKENDSAVSKFAYLSLNPAGKAVLSYRKGGVSNQGEKEQIGFGSWLKLTRTGDTIKAFISLDNAEWKEMGEVTFDNLKQELLVGVAASSRNTLGYVDAKFCDLNVKQ